MNSTKLPPSWRTYIWMPAVIDKMYQMAGELLFNTSDSQISVALQTMMSLKSNKILQSPQKTYAGKPAHCPAAFGRWDWEITLNGKHSTWKIREIRAHDWFNSGNQITWQKIPKFQIEAARKKGLLKQWTKWLLCGQDREGPRSKWVVTFGQYVHILFAPFHENIYVEEWKGWRETEQEQLEVGRKIASARTR